MPLFKGETEHHPFLTRPLSSGTEGSEEKASVRSLLLARLISGRAAADMLPFGQVHEIYKARYPCQPSKRSGGDDLLAG